MQLTSDDKGIMLTALQTEHARLKRAINAEKNLQIKEILAAREAATLAFYGRVSNEPVKESK